MPIASPSEISREVDRAFFLIGGVGVLLLLGITAAMIFFVLKYRRERVTHTAQIEGHLLLEITWIVIPTIIVVWFFFVGYRGFGMMRAVPEDAMEVRVTGRQWSWSFYYPDEKVSAAEMVVPVNTPVKVSLTAPPNDVLHSFYIPDFRVKEDVIPGRDTYLWFTSERTGVFNVFCAEFCGKDHAKMITKLRVVSEEEYRDWLRAMIMKRFKPLEYQAVIDPQHPAFGPEDLNIDAKTLYATYCASCHGVNGDGSGLPGLARSFLTDQNWKRSPKVTDIYRTLMEGIDGTQMRAYPDFTPWEKMALAHHVRSFQATPPPADTEEDFNALVAAYELDKIQGPKERIAIEAAMEILLREAGTIP